VIGEQREDWNDIKAEVLLTCCREKFKQHEKLAAELLATGEKDIVMVDSDEWAGMNAGKGVAQGKNNMGRILMQVRAELQFS